jgi:hypothetical protein
LYTEVRHRVLKLVILTAFTRSSRSIPSPHQNTVSALVHPRLYLDKVHTLVCHVPSRRRSAAPASDNLLIKTNQNNYMAAKSLGESLGRVLQDFRTPYPGSIARFPLAFAQSRSICPGNFGPICFHHHLPMPAHRPYARGTAISDALTFSIQYERTLSMLGPMMNRRAGSA